MEEKQLLKKFLSKNIRAGYYPMLFLLSCLWTAYYNTGLDNMSMASFIAQQAALFSLFQLADTLLSSGKIKFALAGFSSLYVFFLHFNALLLSITSMTLYESITILATGGNFLYTLEEAGLSAVFIALLVILLILIFAAGGLAFRFMPHAGLKSMAARVMLPAFFIVSSLFFIAEQSINKNSGNFFSRRLYPLYIEIFQSNNDTVTFTIPENRVPGTGLYNKITKPANPKNVVFILLESFRRDSINTELSPFMKELAEDSPEITNYFTDAIYTSLAWNTILLDRPAYTLSGDISYDCRHRDGSGIFRIFKNAGYDTYVSFSANMEWKNFHERVNGRDSLIDNYYCGYERRDEERNFIDRRTASRACDWIKQSQKEKPFFMMIQLDSTHWTYYADSENELSKPFAGKDINIAKLRSRKDIELLLNRYKNSVRQVNSGIEKIITALKQNNKYSDTAVVIVSDHGEGFAPGMIGHSVMHEDIKKPAFILHLPGIKRFRSDKFMSHMDIFPTLFDYLKIGGTREITRGRSILDNSSDRKCVLSFHGSILMADLTFDDYTVFFRTKTSGDSVTFTPVKYTDRSGNIIKNRDSAEWKSAIKQIIENRE